MLLPGGPDLAFLVLALVVGCGLNAVLGALPGASKVMGQPASAFADLAIRLETRLNRPQRTAGDRLMRGLATVLTIAGLGLAAGGVLTWLLSGLARGDWITALLVALALPMGRVWALMRRLTDAVDREDEARILALMAEIEPSVGSARRLDPPRAMLNRLGEGLIRDLVAPALLFLLLGLPGFFLSLAVTACRRALGGPGPQLAEFGAAARRMDEVVHVPAAVAGVILLGFGGLGTPTLPPRRAIDLLSRPARRPVAGADPVAARGQRALGHLLGLPLGPGDPDDPPVRAFTPGDLRRGRVVSQMAVFLAIVLLAALLALGGGLSSGMPPG